MPFAFTIISLVSRGPDREDIEQTDSQRRAGDRVVIDNLRPESERLRAVGWGAKKMRRRSGT